MQTNPAVKQSKSVKWSKGFVESVYYYRDVAVKEVALLFLLFVYWALRHRHSCLSSRTHCSTINTQSSEARLRTADHCHQPSGTVDR